MNTYPDYYIKVYSSQKPSNYGLQLDKFGKLILDKGKYKLEYVKKNNDALYFPFNNNKHLEILHFTL